jgi:hypothetical protein
MAKKRSPEKRRPAPKTSCACPISTKLNRLF